MNNDVKEALQDICVCIIQPMIYIHFPSVCHYPSLTESRSCWSRNTEQHMGPGDGPRLHHVSVQLTARCLTRSHEGTHHVTSTGKCGAVEQRSSHRDILGCQVRDG